MNEELARRTWDHKHPPPEWGPMFCTTCGCRYTYFRPRECPKCGGFAWDDGKDNRSPGRMSLQ